MAGKGLYRPALTLIWGNPHLSSLLRVPGCRQGRPPPQGQVSGATCQLTAPSDQQGVRSVRPFSSPAPSASLPSASLSWARGHELQEQDVEEKVFCCVNTALGLRWMNSAKEPMPWSVPFRAGQSFCKPGLFPEMASDTHRKENEGCPSDAATTHNETQTTMLGTQLKCSQGPSCISRPLQVPLLEQ